MTDFSELTYYINPNVTNLLEAFIQSIDMQKVFFEKIIEAQDKIQTIEDALRLPVDAIDIIKDYFTNTVA
jgi:hypothetical protein